MFTMLSPGYYRNTGDCPYCRTNVRVTRRGAILIANVIHQASCKLNPRNPRNTKGN